MFCTIPDCIEHLLCKPRSRQSTYCSSLTLTSLLALCCSVLSRQSTTSIKVCVASCVHHLLSLAYVTWSVGSLCAVLPCVALYNISQFVSMVPNILILKWQYSIYKTSLTLYNPMFFFLAAEFAVIVNLQYYTLSTTFVCLSSVIVLFSLDLLYQMQRSHSSK